MIDSIYHTTNIIPFLGFINSLILISGFYLIGEITIKYCGLKKIIESISKIEYQNILIGVNLVLLFSFPIVLWIGSGSNNIILIFTYLIFSLGLFNFIRIFKKFNFSNFTGLFKNSGLLEVLIYSSLILYFMISASPVTNADSLDYHLHIGKQIASDGNIPLSLNHLHSHLFGNGEIIIAIGILAGTEQLNSIVQFCGLISVLGIIRSRKNKNDFTIYLLSCPLIIFFISSIKPQFFFIASTTFVFGLLINQEILKKEILFKKYILSFILLCLASQAKFSFMLSLGVLGLYILYDSYKNKIFLKTTFTFIPIILLIIFPTIYWKSLYYNSSLFELILSPFPTNDPGLERFKTYLIQAGKGGNILNGIIFPGEFNNITNAIGLASILFFILFKSFKKNTEVIVITTVFITFALIAGQHSSRFLFEPFVWILVALSLKNMHHLIGNVIDKIIKIQFIIFFPAIIYGGLALFPGVINDYFKDKVLEKNANGYSFFKWANLEVNNLNYNGAIIVFERSVSLLNKNLFISKDFIYFTDIDKNEYKNYNEEIKRINPKYIISTSNDIQYIEKYFKNCDLSIIKRKEKIGRHTSRKPFTYGSYYDGLIYKINTNKMPQCNKSKN